MISGKSCGARRALRIEQWRTSFEKPLPSTSRSRVLTISSRRPRRNITTPDPNLGRSFDLQRGRTLRRLSSGLRPYFIHDYDMSWAELLARLHAPDKDSRRWAMRRVLEGARWQDIWRLTSREQIARELPHLRLSNEPEWADVIRKSKPRTA